MTQSIEVYKHWVETLIEEASDELTDWEISFVESIGLRLLRGQNLSEAQANKLESIYAEKTK